MKLTKTALILGAALLTAPLAAVADGHRNAAPEGAMAYFISPADGETITGAVNIVFGLRGMGVAPSGTERDNTGHHHLLINTDPASISYDEPLPATDQIVHFGGGQTEATLDLPAGTHTLRLLLGDWTHIPHDPPVLSEPITITVN